MKKKRTVISVICLALLIGLMILYYIGSGIIEKQNKIKETLKKYKELNGLKYYYSKLPFVIYVDEELPPQEKFGIVLMQKKKPVIAKTTTTNKYLNHSLFNEYLKTDIECRFSDDKMKSLSISYSNRKLFDFNADSIWDFRQIGKKHIMLNIFLNGKWVSCAKIEGKMPNLIAYLKSGDRYSFNTTKGVWERISL